jgi:hypothetical protein
MDLKAAANHGLHVIERNLPTILTVGSWVGLGVTTFLTGKATLEASKKIAEKEEEIDDVLTNTEKVKLVWKCYIPVVATGVTTMMCIYGIKRSGAEQLAAVVAAGRNLEKQIADNRDAVTEVFGDKGLRKVDEKINEERAGRFFVNENTIYETGHGSTLCCEGFLTGTLFRADREYVRQTVNNFNLRLIDGESLSYNDFLQMLIPTIDVSVLPNAGDIFGYDLDVRRHLLEIVEDSFLTQDCAQPGYIFNLRELPLFNYSTHY